MPELYLDPQLWEFVDELDEESYRRFCTVSDACAYALGLMSIAPDACTARAFGVTVRVERNTERQCYVICAIEIVDLDPPPDGWGKGLTVLEPYFEIAPDVISDRRLPPARERRRPTRNDIIVSGAERFESLGYLTRRVMQPGELRVRLAPTIARAHRRADPTHPTPALSYALPLADAGAFATVLAPAGADFGRSASGDAGSFGRSHDEY